MRSSIRIRVAVSASAAGLVELDQPPVPAAAAAGTPRPRRPRGAPRARAPASGTPPADRRSPPRSGSAMPGSSSVAAASIRTRRSNRDRPSRSPSSSRAAGGSAWRAGFPPPLASAVAAAGAEPLARPGQPGRKVGAVHRLPVAHVAGGVGRLCGHDRTSCWLGSNCIGVGWSAFAGAAGLTTGMLSTESIRSRSRYVPAVKPCRPKLSWLVAAGTGSRAPGVSRRSARSSAVAEPRGSSSRSPCVGPFRASLTVSGALLTSLGASATGTALLGDRHRSGRVA